MSDGCLIFFVFIISPWIIVEGALGGALNSVF